MPGGGLSLDFACLGLKRGIKRKRAVPVILKAMSLGTSWAQRQYRIEAIKCLNGGFFIDTEHSGVLRRIQIKADDIGGFGLEIRIVTGHVPLQPVRLDSSLLPDAVHQILADTKRLASLRQLQCVDPSVGFLRVAFNTLARKPGVNR